jgi:LytR cell envelope-related transcriptional attenuator
VTTYAEGRRPVPGSFSRSMMAAAGRGAALVGVAVLLGIFLLQVTDDSGPSGPERVIGGSGTATSTTTTTTTTVPGGPGAGVRPPQEVRVLVINAAKIDGIAGEITDALAEIGYQTLTPGNAPQQDESVVFSKSEFDAEATAVATAVGEAKPIAEGALTEPLPDPSPIAGTETADIVVVIGAP